MTFNHSTPPTQNSIPASPALRELDKLNTLVTKSCLCFDGLCEDCENLREAMANIYAAGYKDGMKAGLMEAREMMPIKDHVAEGINTGHGKDEYWGCCECYEDTQCNDYREEALARINEKINSLKASEPHNEDKEII